VRPSPASFRRTARRGAASTRRSTRPRDDAEAQAEAEAVAQAIGLPLLVDGVRLSARASVGVARSLGEEGADALVAAADAVMYRTKTERRRVART
jgi:PleD family two-component response regulator